MKGFTNQKWFEFANEASQRPERERSDVALQPALSVERQSSSWLVPKLN